MRPKLLSRARQTFDMLPCPVRPINSKRSLTLILFSPLSFLGPNSFFNFAKKLTRRPLLLSGPSRKRETKPCRLRFRLGQTWSMLAVADDARDLRAQLFAMDDAVDETVFEQELTRLKALGQFEAHRVP